MSLRDPEQVSMALTRFLSLRVQIVLLVMMGTLLVFGLVQYYSYVESRQIIRDISEKEASNLAAKVGSKMEEELRSVVALTENFASWVETSDPDAVTLLRQIKRLVERQSEVFGSTVAFEPFAFQHDLKAYAPYYYKSPTGVEFRQLGTDKYNYFDQEWFLKPKELRKGYWTKPYFDEGGGDVIMSTYSYPIFHHGESGPDARIKAIVTADISVSWLTKELSEVRVKQSGFCFLISKDGTFITAPDDDWIMKESIFSIAEKRGNPRLREVGEAMLGGQSGFLDIGRSLVVRDSFLAFSRLRINGWSLGVVFPKRELYADVDALHQATVGLAVVGIGMLLAMSLFIARSVTKPVRAMVAATSKIAHGDLDVDLSGIQRSDDLGQLARSFDRMAVDLKKYIHDLTETTAAKERIQSELNLAARIQKSMLPSKFPPFPDHNEFEIFAVMDPAKEVGGDGYQFFLEDDSKLCFAVADVAGKGVPAALFMTVTTYLLRTIADQGARPDQILYHLNRALARNNDSCTFVTVFCGILDFSTGELLYTNAGHNPPLLVSERTGLTVFGAPDGPVAGVFDEAEYGVNSLTMQPRDTLLLFTDGVTEAFNTKDEAYGEERLEKFATGLIGKTATEMVKAVRQDVALFSTGAPQSDDITVMAIMFNGSRD